MATPKIVIIGAGSLFFGRKAIAAMCKLPGLKAGQICLVDTDREHLRIMKAIAERARATASASFEIQATSDFREALPGADFVILSFSRRNAYYRRIDCQVSATYGIRMCSGDTIGPGGIFRAARELPDILEIARETEKLAPEAWLINYINPTSVNGIALMRHSNLKSFALCDSLWMPQIHRNLLKTAGIDDPDLSQAEIRIAGVNHFTWALKLEYEGEDMGPRILARMREMALTEKDEGYSKARFNHTIGVQLWEAFGCLPCCIGHTKEYVPYYQGHDVVPGDQPPPPLAVFDCDEREEITWKFWEANRAWAEGDAPISSFLEQEGSDHATDIIQAIVADSGTDYYINTANEGSVPNLPRDAFLELLCTVDANGPRPKAAGEMPMGLRGLQMQVLDTHELTVEAIVKGDLALLKRAILTDPITLSMRDGLAAMKALLEREKDVLPAFT